MSHHNLYTYTYTEKFHKQVIESTTRAYSGRTCIAYGGLVDYCGHIVPSNDPGALSARGSRFHSHPHERLIETSDLMPYPAHYRIPDRSPHTELPILLDHVYKTIIRIIKISRNNSKYQSLTVRRSGIAKGHPPCSHLPMRIGRMADSTMMLNNIIKDHH